MKINFLTNQINIPAFGSKNEKKEYSRVKIPVYLIGRDGDYKKFSSVNKTKAFFQTNSGSVNRAFQKEHPYNDYFIINAKKIEDEVGNIDRKMIASYIERFSKIRKPNSKGGRPKIEVYSINPKGECVKYPSITALAEALNSKVSSIYTVFRNGHKLHGYYVKQPFEIETEKGEIDKQKVKELLQKPSRIKQAMYSINPETGEFSRFDSVTDLAKHLKCNPITITHANNTGYLVKKHIVRKASLLENEDGKLDILKIKRILEERELKKAEKLKKREKKKKTKIIEEKISPVYAINIKSGKHIKFPSIEKASEVFGVHKNQIRFLLENIRQVVCNCRLVNAKKVEDENGNVDEEKIKRFIKLV